MCHIMITHIPVLFIVTFSYVYFRIRNWDYLCICNEDCKLKGTIMCSISKATRTFCRYCRYIRCGIVGGMCEELVGGGSSIARVKRCKRSRSNKTC